MQNTTVKPDDFSPLETFGAVFTLASLGGLAALLRSGKKLTVRSVGSAMLNGGLIGLIIALVWWHRYGGADLYFLVGVSALAGFGGAETIRLAVLWGQKKLGLETDDE